MVKPFSPNLLPPGKIDWHELVGPIGNARAALGSYSGGLASIPNPAVLLSPLTTQEAVLSSKIEGTVVTLEEVLEFDADPQGGGERERDIHEVINYRRALRHAADKLPTRPTCLNLVKEVHSILLEDVRGERKGRGTFRQEQVHIGPPGSTMEEASYVPPTWDKVEALMSDWETYYHDTERDPLVQLAILHGQFEVIHPFLDGNGRVGRMLIPLFLYDKGMLGSPMFYMSAYLDATSEEYYERLNAISSRDNWQGWIVYFIDAVARQATSNGAQVRAIMSLYDETKRVFREAVRSAYAIQALDFLFSVPIFKSAAFTEGTRIPDGTSQRLLRLLTDNGTLTVMRERSGRRPAIYAFSQLLKIVNTPVDPSAEPAAGHPPSSTDDQQSLPPSPG